MKRLIAMVSMLFIASTVFAAPSNYDTDQDQVQVMVEQMDNTSIEVAIVNLETLDVYEMNREIATVEAFKTEAGHTAILTIYNGFRNLYVVDEQHNYGSSDIVLKIPWREHNCKQPNSKPGSNYQRTSSGGMPGTES